MGKLHRQIPRFTVKFAEDTADLTLMKIFVDPISIAKKLKSLIKWKLRNALHPFYNLQKKKDQLELIRICNQKDGQSPFLHVIVVCYKRFGEMKILLQSWINQSDQDWVMTIIHDGQSTEFDQIVQEYKSISSGKIMSFSTNIRYDDYGHTLRSLGLECSAAKYTLITNGDNYFIPKTVQYLKEKYMSFLLEEYKIDMSSAIVKTEISRAVGINSIDHGADQQYYSDIRNSCHEIREAKVNRVLLVHN